MSATTFVRGFLGCIAVAALVAVMGCDRIEPEEEAEQADDITEMQIDPPERLQLPTSNEALFEADGPAFYQYVDRTFQGRRSMPWQAGQYGFVRNPRETDRGIVYTRFHEGIDIKPLYRDEAGNALDTVRSIDAGQVVYVNTAAGQSNYGKYVVVEHQWDESPFYSLYAHLSRIDVAEGTSLEQGGTLGIMGHTGRGLGRERAHLHLEIGMLINQHFQSWFDTHYANADNEHGIYSGLNLVGLDVASLYRSLQGDDSLQIRDFVRGQEVLYEVLVPGPQPPDLVNRYPWLMPSGEPTESASWKIAFSREAVPVRIEPSERAVEQPRVARVEPAELPYQYLSSGFLTGRDEDVYLTQKGARFMGLFMAHAAS